MKYILLFAWVLLLFCNCHTSRTFTHNTNSPDTLIRLIAYGRSSSKALRVQSMLSSKWSFYYDCVFGCTISQAEIDSVERINAIAERPLIARYGKKWKEKFGRELKIAMATPGLICLLFHFDAKVEAKRKELKLQGDTLFIISSLQKLPAHITLMLSDGNARVYRKNGYPTSNIM